LRSCCGMRRNITAPTKRPRRSTTGLTGMPPTSSRVKTGGLPRRHRRARSAPRGSCSLRRSHLASRNSQEERWAEWNEPVELAERPVGHQEVDPPVDSKASGEEMPDRHVIGPRHLELEAFEADGVSHPFDMNQDCR